MFHRYDYEAEYYPSLSRLPLDLRRKLDLSGIKLSLKDWLAISLEERIVLCHLPCDNVEERQTFALYLDFLARKYHGKPTDKTHAMDSGQWSESAVPGAVAQRSAATGQAVTPIEWRRWHSHHRYALYKTATSNNQPEAFERVLQQLRQLATHY
ncbi:MAG: nitrate reductase associated protein [Candidatus Binatia bacterium]